MIFLRRVLGLVVLSFFASQSFSVATPRKNNSTPQWRSYLGGIDLAMSFIPEFQTFLGLAGEYRPIANQWVSLRGNSDPEHALELARFLVAFQRLPSGGFSTSVPCTERALIQENYLQRTQVAQFNQCIAQIESRSDLNGPARQSRITSCNGILQSARSLMQCVSQAHAAKASISATDPDAVRIAREIGRSSESGGAQNAIRSEAQNPADYAQVRNGEAFNNARNLIVNAASLAVIEWSHRPAILGAIAAFKGGLQSEPLNARFLRTFATSEEIQTQLALFAQWNQAIPTSARCDSEHPDAIPSEEHALWDNLRRLCAARANAEQNARTLVRVYRNDLRPSQSRQRPH